LEILSVKKEAKLSASELADVKAGKGEEDLRCKRLLTVCVNNVIVVRAPKAKPQTKAQN